MKDSFIITHSSLTGFFLLIIVLFTSKVSFGKEHQNTKVGSDSSKFVIINEIILSGNKITHPSIILRELRFQKGDSLRLDSLTMVLRTSRENVFNTSLFNFVTCDTLHLKGEANKINILIRVIERWYIWPWPYLVLSDRNLNSWLETMDLGRFTYGTNVTFYNVWGRNETLIFPVHFGFNQRYGFTYNIPYINRKETIGIGFGADYRRNHEVIEQSMDNKPVYYKDDQVYPKQLWDVFFQLLWRPGIYTRQTFEIHFYQYHLSDSLLKVPGYSFDNTTNNFHYFSFFYQFRDDHRDIHYYPLRGYYFGINLLQNGFFGDDVNTLSIMCYLRKYWQLDNRWYFASGLTGKGSFTSKPVYFLEQALGYGRDYVRGYEYYVVDGQDFIVFKNNLKFALLPQRVKKLDFLRSTKFNPIPYALYLNLFADLGYAYNENKIGNQFNSLQNTLLIGYGAGLDFTTYYDIVIRLEFSVNRMGEPGFYLHFVAPI
jgi:outer membrane protein assembly factor BamA